MSITSLVRRAEIKELFASTINRPPPIPKKSMVAPPLTENYRLVGAAFDYLMRFYLQRLNPDSKTQNWIAEKATTNLYMSGSLSYDIDEDRLEVHPRIALAEKYLLEARQQYQQYLKRGAVTDKLLISAFRLAHLDVLYRAGPDFFDEAKLKKINREDILDLKGLVSAIDKKQFTSRTACYLNPTFGTASHLVGGADADIILDNKIIEIKTTKSLNLDRRDLYQLIGYYILLLLDGITIKESGKKMYVSYANDISNVVYIGIYFSRHAYLHLWSVGDLLDPNTLVSFAKRFIEYACPKSDRRATLLQKCCGQLAKQVLGKK